MAIRKLPPLLVSQIAAGEVIDRPASVVKELIENSIDAGATRIDIAAEEGGCALIRIRDDGEGITRDDLALAVAPHATSKLDRAEQIASIETLGFRGEALASIASVSRMRITSCAASHGRRAEEGWTLDVAGETIAEPVPAPASPGTVIAVRDLFFNTPARRRFLRTPATEAAHLQDTVLRAAMAWQAIGFSLTHNGRQVVDVGPGQTPRQRGVSLLGRELDEALLEFEHEEDGMHLWGLAAVPSVTRANARGCHLAVNGRVVRDRGLTHAVREGYRGLIPPDRHPVCVVRLAVDPQRVDVNVHPTKAEVRWAEPRRIHGLVLTCVRRCLMEADLTPSVPLAPAPHGAAPRGPHTEPAAAGQVSERGEPWLRPEPPAQRGFDFDTVQRGLEEARDAAPVVSDAQAAVPAARAASPAILQVHNSYLVTEDEAGLLIVDQHALHERVMFEQLRTRILSRPLESQRLLVPVLLDVSAGQMAALEPLQSLLEQIGIDAQSMGPLQVAVHAFPSFLFERGVEPKAFVLDLLDQAEAGTLQPDDDTPASREAVVHRVLDMMACKAAVKAGDRMTPQELADLMAQRERVERSSACPHGRPTTVRLTLKDLAKQFKRT